MSENKGNKLVVDDIEVIVRGVANKPYYEIKYREVGTMIITSALVRMI